MGLDDYAQALGAAQRLIPNWRQGDLVEARLAQERLQPQIAQAQIAENQAQTRAIDFKQQRQAVFQSRLQQLGAKPSPQAYRALGAEFPEFHEAIDSVASGLDGDQAKSTVRRLAPVQALITNKRYDDAAAEVKRHLDADKAAGLPEDEDDRHLYDELTSGDPARQQASGGIVYGLLASLDPKNAAANIGKVVGDRNKVVSAGGALVDETGKVLYQAPQAETNALEVGVYDDQGHRVGTRLIANGGRGGDPSSAGEAAGRGSDVSRLINSDAGGGQVPSSVQTLGQFVSWGRALNKNGARSSSAGTYQINGTTMAEFAPQALGADWRSAPFTADAQEKVGKAIFDWAKQQPNPAAALKGRWVSLSGSQAAQLVRGDWSQARGTIAAGETGGGPSASASPGRSGGSGYIGPVASSGSSQYRLLTPQENVSRGLDANIKYQEGPNGQLTALGGQSRAQLKPIPPKAADALVTNNSSIRNIDSAIRLLDPRNQSAAAKNARYAIGTSNRFIPDAVLQNTNPDGVSFRAQIGQIGGLLIKDISGAAVSASEDDRLAKWVPLVTDTPRAALDKLRNLKRELAAKNETISTTYGEDQGYRQPGSSQQAANGFRILRVRPK